MGISEKLIPSFEKDLWASMDDRERYAITLRAMDDPVFFWEHPALGGIDTFTWKNVDQSPALENYPKDKIVNNSCELKLWPKQKEIMTEFSKRTKEGVRKYDEMFYIAGRGSSKSSLTAMLALHEVFRWVNTKNPLRKYNLLQGTKVKVSYVANKEKSVEDVMFDPSIAMVCKSPYLYNLNPVHVKKELRFPNDIQINYYGTNALSNVGRTVKMMVFDEAANLDQETTSNRSSQSIYDHLATSTNRFLDNEGIRVCASAIRHSTDFMMENYNRVLDHPLDNPSTLVYNVFTYHINPKYTIESIEKERKRNPTLFAQLYENEPGLEIQRFFEPEIISYVKENSKNENLFTPEGGILPFKKHLEAWYYIWGLDPSSKRDAFGLSLGYVTADLKVVIVGSKQFKKSKATNLIDYNEILLFINNVHKYIRPRYALFDIYFVMHFVDAFRSAGIEVVQHTLTRQDWLFFRDDLTETRPNVVLPKYDFLIEEMEGLVDIRQMKIDHQRNGTKDVADSVCQITSFIRRAQAEIAQNKMKKRKEIKYTGRTSFNGKIL